MKKSKTKISYSTSGVNLDIGNIASKILYDAAKKTWQNREKKFGNIFSPFDDFSGLRAIKIGGLKKNIVACLGFDGVGTKIEIAERVGNHTTIAFDLFAMVCDDAVVRGGEPVIIGSVLDINSLSKKNNGIEIIQQLATGYVNAAKESNVAVINGELAELGSRISGFGNFNYTWSSGILWIAEEKNLISGKNIKVGDILIGLEETGFRSNGISLVRKILSEKFGGNWHQKKLNGKKLGEIILHPSKIFCKSIVKIIGGILYSPKAKISGIAHITGGGIPEKLGRMLKPSDFGAIIDNPIDAPEIMNYCAKIGNINLKEMYRSWNMGTGMILSANKNEVEKIISILKKEKINTKIIGKIISDKKIIINTKNNNIEFPLK